MIPGGVLHPHNSRVCNSSVCACTQSETLVCMDRLLYQYTISGDPNNLTCKSSDTYDEPRDPCSTYLLQGALTLPVAFLIPYYVTLIHTAGVYHLVLYYPYVMVVDAYLWSIYRATYTTPCISTPDFMTPDVACSTGSL